METAAPPRRRGRRGHPGFSRRSVVAGMYIWDGTKASKQMLNELDLKRLKVYPLAARKSMSRIEEILVDPDAPPPACSEAIRLQVQQCAQHLAAARQRQASVM